MGGPTLPRRAGKLSVDLDAGTVALDGERIPVTDEEYAVLQLLFARVVASRSSLEAAVSGSNLVENSSKRSRPIPGC